MFPKKLPLLIFAQALLCALEAYLISKISLLGRIGIAMFYKEYKFLRSGWKTFLVLFLTQLLLILLLNTSKKWLAARIYYSTAFLLLIFGILGLWGTYYDFQYTFTHRLLKEKFHLGFYLFWLAWMGTSITFLLTPPNKMDAPILPQSDDLTFNNP